MNPAHRFPPGDTADVRPRNEFRIGHFASAICCPLDELTAHLHRLPDRSRRLWVFGAEDEVDEAIAWLGERGFERVERHPAAGAFASPDEIVSSPWVEGPERVRLWEPNPFLEEMLRTHVGSRAGAALDVACGSGRDSCWLAMAGYRVTGVDRLADALAKGADLARDCWRVIQAAGGEPPFTPPTWIEADIEAGWPFANRTFDLVACVRYLHRPLLPRLAAVLSPGGTLVYETFTERQAEFGKPRRPEYLLAEGELRESLEKLGLETLVYRESCPPGGPALASLCARKPRSAPGPRRRETRARQAGGTAG